MIKLNEQFIAETKSQLKSSNTGKTDFSNIAHFPLNSKQGIYVADWKSGTISYQRGIDKILGYEKSEFTLEKALSIAHPEDLNLIKRITQAVVNHLIRNIEFSYNDTYMIITYRFQKKDGSYIKVMRQSTLYEKTLDGKLKSNLSLLTDVSTFDKTNTVNWEFLAPEIEQEAFRNSIYKEFSTLFTKREIEIINLIATNHTTKEIASKLYISEHTVYSHRKNILRKSNCHNAQELILFCYKVGVL